MSADPDNEELIPSSSEARRSLLVIALPFVALIIMGLPLSTLADPEAVRSPFLLPSIGSGLCLLAWIGLLTRRVSEQSAGLLVQIVIDAVALWRWYGLSTLGTSGKLETLFPPLLAYLPLVMVFGFLLLEYRRAWLHGIFLMASTTGLSVPLFIYAFQSDPMPAGTLPLLLFFAFGQPLLLAALWFLATTLGVREYAAQLANSKAELERRTEELRRVNAELESFGQRVAHDLRAPLRSINGFLGIISKRYGAQLPSEAHELFARTTSASRDLERMIRALLEFARSGAAPDRMETLGLEDACLAARERLESDIEAFGATIECVGELGSVHGNSDAITQLFQNLFENAIKYAHPERAPHIQLSAEHTDEGVMLRVCDNGVGIRPDQRKQVLRAFQRGRDAGGVGLGIGLATCDRIMRAHGGTLRIDGNPAGEGTCVVLEFPPA